MQFLKPKKIIVHCSATKDTASKSWDVIRYNHININGWLDIGYHYGVEYVGDTVKMMHGRMPWVVGAHCRAQGRNHDSLGVMIVGNFDITEPDNLIYDESSLLIAMLCFTFNIEIKHIYAHRDFDNGKTCPGRNWNMDITRIKAYQHYSMLTNNS